MAGARLSILFLFKEYRVCLNPNADPRAQEWIVTKAFYQEQVRLGLFGILLPAFPISPILPILPPCLTCPNLQLLLRHILLHTGHLKCKAANVQH